MEFEALVATSRIVDGGWRIVDGRLDFAPMMETVLSEGLVGREAAETFHGTLIAGLRRVDRRRSVRAKPDACRARRRLHDEPSAFRGTSRCAARKRTDPCVAARGSRKRRRLVVRTSRVRARPGPRSPQLDGGVTMCLAIPVEVREVLPDDMAKVGLDGVVKVISTALVDDVQVGDYVVLHVGYALAKIDPEEARKTIELLKAVGAAA